MEEFLYFLFTTIHDFFISFHVFNFRKLFSIEFLYEFNEHNIFSYFSKDSSDSNFCWFVLTLAWTISCLAYFFFLSFFKAFFQLFGAHSCLLIFISVLIENQWEVFNVWDEWNLFTLVCTVRWSGGSVFGKSLMFLPVGVSFGADQIPDRQPWETTQLEADVFRAKWLKRAGDYWTSVYEYSANLYFQQDFLLSTVSYFS